MSSYESQTAIFLYFQAELCKNEDVFMTLWRNRHRQNNSSPGSGGRQQEFKLYLVNLFSRV
jgi:hypothetical protein